MHNRVRMVVARFLVKDLHLDWPRGARGSWSGCSTATSRRTSTAGSGSRDRARRRPLPPHVQPGEPRVCASTPTASTCGAGSQAAGWPRRPTPTSPGSSPSSPAAPIPRRSWTTPPSTTRRWRVTAGSAEPGGGRCARMTPVADLSPTGAAMPSTEVERLQRRRRRRRALGRVGLEQDHLPQPWYAVGIFVVVFLLGMLRGNHVGHVEDYVLIAFAGPGGVRHRTRLVGPPSRLAPLANSLLRRDHPPVAASCPQAAAISRPRVSRTVLHALGPQPSDELTLGRLGLASSCCPGSGSAGSG